MELFMPVFDLNDTFEKVASIVSDVLHVEKQKISQQTTLDELGADSLDKLEIVMKLEEMFGIEIDDEEAAKINSIGQAVEKINALRTK